jgi:hypothetical protein
VGAVDLPDGKEPVYVGRLPKDVRREAAVVVLGAHGDFQGFLGKVDAAGFVKLDSQGVHLREPVDGLAQEGT